MILCSYVEKKLLEKFYRFILGRNGMFVPLHRQKDKLAIYLCGDAL